MCKIYFLILSSILLMSCVDEEGLPPFEVLDLQLIEQLNSSYTLLPEEQMTVSTDNRTIALYASPTTEYGHGILGDKVEAKELVLTHEGIIYDITLEDGFVFEDIRPRLFDVDEDNIPEVITIRTDVSAGAGIAIYKIVDNELSLYAKVPVIGRAYRWLNIVTIDDLDRDGNLDIAWVQTPHIGGIFKIATLKGGILTPTASLGEFSNHAIGERNLCMSAISTDNDQTVTYIPNQQGDSIVGLTYSQGTIHRLKSIPLDVDFAVILQDQHDFTAQKVDLVNCIGG